MDSIVGLIAIVRLKVHGHCPIACDTEAVNQLLEIGTALLGMPRLKLNRSRVLTIVSTPDHHAGSVVVDPIHLEIETLHDRQHDARLQARAIRRKQAIESASESIVVDFAPRQEPWFERLAPFPDRIERVALHQDVLHQRQQCIGIARVLQRQCQFLLEPHALDERVQNRERAHAQGA